MEEFSNQDTQNPGFQNQGLPNPNFQNQGFQNQGFQNQGFQNQYYPSGSYDASLNQPFLRNLAGWATFKGVMEIIVGIMNCMGFILILPAVYGVMQIISGVKLMNAADDLKKYIASNDTRKISDTFFNMQKYFRLNGISLIIQICSVVIIMILYFIFFAYLFSNPDVLENIFGGFGY